MKILVLNSGSSSVKLQVFDKEVSIVTGLIEQIGEANSSIVIFFHGKEVVNKQIKIKTHFDGLQMAADYLLELGVVKDLNEFHGIGHRVVHGGSYFDKAELVTDEVIQKIERLQPLAPLHNQAHLDGIKVTQQINPLVPNIVVFDTAFHQSIPDFAYMYALPYNLYEEDKVRRYGFHGTSHHFVAKEAAKMLNKNLNELNAITLHLGNGASATAIKNGKSIDTSMGLTPLEGLIMGTRSGDIDPAILFYLHRKRGYNNAQLDNLLNKESGLKGICGVNDMREIHSMAKHGNEKAQLALDMFSYRIKKYIGSYSAVLGSVDCIVFTGGIGENDAYTRLKSCENLENLGIEIDEEENYLRKKGVKEISSKNSKVKIFVIPTNEELEIALQTKGVVQNLLM